MANPHHLKQLDKGTAAWNQWRMENPDLRLDLCHAHLEGRNLIGANLTETNLTWTILTGANLSKADLSRAELRKANLAKTNLHGANFRRANLIYTNLNRANLSAARLRYVTLRMANLQGANLYRADLTEADLRHANLREADLSHSSLHQTDLRHAKMSKARLVQATIMDADLSEADLTDADLSEAALNRSKLIGSDLEAAILRGANLENANLRGANLSRANLRAARLYCTTLVEANLRQADLTGSAIYGVAVWNAHLEETSQSDLLITRSVDPEQFLLEPAITVDHLEAAQLLYQLFQNEHTPAIISSLMSRVLLIFGQFTPKRKEAFKTILHDLWEQNYVPVLVDVTTLQDPKHAAMINALISLSRGILIDLSDVQDIGVMFPRRAVPIQPLLAEGQREHDVFAGFYHQMLPLYRYQDMASLRRFLTEYLHLLPSLTK